MKNYIKDIRNERGITQGQLAELVGLDQTTVQRHESGSRRLSYEIIEKYSKALECHPIDITEGPANTSITKTDEEKELLQTFRGLSDSARQMHLHMLKSFNQKDK